MSSILASNGVVFATAMAAVSGTVILLAFRLQKSPPNTATQFSIIAANSSSSPRPCLSSDGKKREKKKKKVHFAEDVVDPVGNSDEFRRLHRGNSDRRNNSSSSSAATIRSNGGGGSGGAGVAKMPANRMALYNGILRDRVVQRVGYSY